MKKTSYILTIPLLSFVGRVQAKQPMPNIIFVLADDMGWNDLGCYSNKYIESHHGFSF